MTRPWWTLRSSEKLERIRRANDKYIVIEEHKLPWDGYSEESPLFSKEAIALVEPLIKEKND